MRQVLTKTERRLLVEWRATGSAAVGASLIAALRGRDNTADGRGKAGMADGRIDHQGSRGPAGGGEAERAKRKRGKSKKGSRVSIVARVSARGA